MNLASAEMSLLSVFLVLLASFTVDGAIREAKDEEFPFQVSIQTTDKRHLCGGAIIAPKWILSAASCFRNQKMVQIVYGSADSNNQNKVVLSEEIKVENGFGFGKSRLALVRLQRAIEFSNTAKQAALPLQKTELRNTTKLSGWQTIPGVSLPPSLYVADTYFVIPKNCKSFGGLLVHLEIDEFCGLDEEEQNSLYNPGAIVSKRDIALGILSELPTAGGLPFIYVKLSEHEQWIRDTLGSDADYVNWVEKVPKDSAPSHCAVSLVLLGVSAFLLRFL